MVAYRQRDSRFRRAKAISRVRSLSYRIASFRCSSPSSIGMVALLVRLGYEVVIDAFSVTAHVCAQLKRENSATAAVGVRSSSPWLNSLVRLFNFGMHLKFVIASHPAERPCHLLQACIMQLFVVGHLEAHATLSRIYRLAVDMIQVHRPGFAYLDFPALLASLDYATDSDLSTNQLDLADCSAKLIDRINTSPYFPASQRYLLF